MRRGHPITQRLRDDRGLVYEKLSDPILVTRARDGDQQALETLLERHAPKVERLALQFLRDPEDARDATQEALAKVCVRLKQFRGGSQFSTWLHRFPVWPRLAAWPAVPRWRCKDFVTLPPWSVAACRSIAV